ncbi:hypothetical protein JCM1841_001178 [Sporobolomyces salmonicolor]
MPSSEYPPPRVPSPTPQSTLRARSALSVTDLTVHIPSSARSADPTSSPASSAPPARWTTPEFYLYYVVFLAVVPQMWNAAVRVSTVTHPLFWTYQHRLSEGWLLGWRVDVSDHQWRLFRSHLPLLFALVFLHLSFSHLSRLVLPRTRTARARFIAISAVALLSALHGSSLPKMLLILWVNWRIGLLATTEGGWWARRWTPWATWVFNAAVLFLNETYGGYSWGSLSGSLAWLDEYKGLLPRWHISWNITMLRLISFNMELYWAVVAAKAAALPSPLEKVRFSLPSSFMSSGHLLLRSSHPPKFQAAQSTSTSPSATRSSRARDPAPDPAPSAQNYTFTLYLAYALYSPLYLAGPILSYPAFWKQLDPSPSAAPSPTSPITGSTPPQGDPELRPQALFAYALRFLVCLLTMELVTHSMYVVAIKDSGFGWWAGMSAFEVSMVGFWNLIVVWLKLLIPWRLFRLWALLDGINPPENMVRCMANNYSTLGFWRAWHRSYNLWIVRYLYIPLGGGARPLLATLCVFTFVALWHDLSFRLLAWGWTVSLFVVPELLSTALLPASKYGARPWYRHVAAAGGVANVLMMMTANLVGFVVGIDGAKELWGVMLGGWEGRVFLLVASACLFVAIQVMFEYREEERRRGINRRC